MNGREATKEEQDVAVKVIDKRRGCGYMAATAEDVFNDEEAVGGGGEGEGGGSNMTDKARKEECYII